MTIDLFVTDGQRVVRQGPGGQEAQHVRPPDCANVGADDLCRAPGANAVSWLL